MTSKIHSEIYWPLASYDYSNNLTTIPKLGDSKSSWGIQASKEYLFSKKCAFVGNSYSFWSCRIYAICLISSNKSRLYQSDF